MRAELSALTGAVVGFVGVFAACGPRHEPIKMPPPVEVSMADAAVAPPITEEWTKPYPQTRREDVVEDLHGTKVADPYRWLEDASAPEVQTWMEAQDAYTRAQLAALPGRDALVARLKELFYYDALGAPIHRGDRNFYSRKHASKEKTVVYWNRENDKAKD